MVYLYRYEFYKLGRLAHISFLKMKSTHIDFRYSGIRLVSSLRRILHAIGFIAISLAARAEVPTDGSVQRFLAELSEARSVAIFDGGKLIKVVHLKEKGMRIGTVGPEEVGAGLWLHVVHKRSLLKYSFSAHSIKNGQVSIVGDDMLIHNVSVERIKDHFAHEL